MIYNVLRSLTACCYRDVFKSKRRANFTKEIGALIVDTKKARGTASGLLVTLRND